ncbi:hypothetical protein [Streptomyces sp. V1I1]|uniref:hypothetical protein n=1 Tax=Streptomyces sp. V1I1 TaxID=3042272 RepID=UPI0027803EEC|nr:hypothetical protein [Streptomyces sp. V1I1]MDQ0944330.1 hypothetical protein [Streptomyces sp. V1I1]
MDRTAALRLDAEWAKVRSGRAGVSPGERERMLTDLIAALAPHADDDLSLAARLSLRYGDLARHHFDTGRREDALSAVGEAVQRCEEPARHDEEHARWYARALINQSVYLADPLSDELGMPRYAFHPNGEQPPPVDREDGLAALAATRRAIEVWESLDGSEPRNREGLAQAHVFLGDRLEELGEPVDAAAWAVRAEREFHTLWPAALDAPDAPGAPDARETAHAAALEHLGDQLERRLRRCPFDGGLTRLREQDLLPERLLPLAVVAARIEGVQAEAIAEGLRLDGTEVRRILRARSWRAVWRFDVQEADGTWTPMTYPWRGRDAVADRSAEAVAAELTDAFVHSPDRPPPSVHWRIAVWWEEEDHLDGARFRLTYAPP